MLLAMSHSLGELLDKAKREGWTNVTASEIALDPRLTGGICSFQLWRGALRNQITPRGVFCKLFDRTITCVVQAMNSQFIAEHHGAGKPRLHTSYDEIISFVASIIYFCVEGFPRLTRKVRSDQYRQRSKLSPRKTEFLMQHIEFNVNQVINQFNQDLVSCVQVAAYFFSLFTLAHFCSVFHSSLVPEA
jgi:hypothetical protein